MNKLPDMKLTLGWTAAVALLVGWSAASAGDFDYGAFTRATVGEAKAKLLAEANPSLNALRNTGADVARFKFLDHGGHRWRVSVIYTGRSRPLMNSEANFVREWLKSEQIEFPSEQLASCYFFTDGGKEYCLPVQAPVASFFERELKPGDHIDLFILDIGAIFDGKDWDWLPVVEEFKATASEG